MPIYEEQGDIRAKEPPECGDTRICLGSLEILSEPFAGVVMPGNLHCIEGATLLVVSLGRVLCPDRESVGFRVEAGGEWNSRRPAHPEVRLVQRATLGLLVRDYFVRVLGLVRLLLCRPIER